MRLPFNRIIIHRGRLRWLLRQEQLFHHYLVNKTFEQGDDGYSVNSPYPKNAKPVFCKCEGCQS